MDSIASENILLVQGIVDLISDLDIAEEQIVLLRTDILNILEANIEFGSAEFERRLKSITDGIRKFDEPLVERLSENARMDNWFKLSQDVGKGAQDIGVFEPRDFAEVKIELKSEIEKPSAEKTYQVAPVFFATDRQRSGNSNYKRFYNGNYSDELQYGIAEVSIPVDHTRAAFERPPWWKMFLKENPNKYISVVGLANLKEGNFLSKFSHALTQSRTTQSLVLIHGYKVKFYDALCHAAQLSYDMNFQGVPILYSWPSYGHWYGYPWDATNVGTTLKHFERVMGLLRNEVGSSAVHTLSHSMGNRLIRSYIERSYRETHDVGLHEVVMAAPDIDAKDFIQNLVPEAWETSKRNTMYASSKDWALKLSKIFNGYPRLGDTRNGVVEVEEIEALDSTSVRTGILGHSYYGDAPSVVTDLDLVINQEMPINVRPGVKPVVNKKHWYFVP